MNEKTEVAPPHASLRDLIGQAISDEIAAGAEQPDWCDSREIDRLANAVLAVLTASSGEPFMHAIMEPAGKPYMDEFCVAKNAEDLHSTLNGLNDSPDAGYSIVPVFLVAPQQHAQAALSDDLPPLPEMDGLQDIPYALNTPNDWDADYANTWSSLQVAERNKMQWRVYALKLRDILATCQPAPVASAPAVAGSVDAKPVELEQIHAAAARHKMALVPLHLTRSMHEVLADEWEWEDLLAAAEAITDEQYAEVCAGPSAARRRVEELEYLLEAAQQSTAKGDALSQQSAPTAQQERAWFKAWLASADGNITVDQIEFGRRVWAERARRAAEGGV